MTKRSPLAVLEPLIVLVPGCLGLYIVARALAAYWNRDLAATVIVAIMALALVYGLIELLVRLRGAGALQDELDQLPASPSEATVDGASPRLSALLRARLEQAPLSGLGEGVAPFLTGLLVMLGLLGTLLGLFETVRGAGAALTTSVDVDSLRHSLTTPIDGLTRSFGCSAAGISASAMLGFAVALVRRREARVLRSVFAYAAGPLRVLSPARRQTRALEQLASQGSALPDASGALNKVAAQLAQLSERMVSMQESTAESQKRAFDALVSSLRSELAKVAGEAGSALHGRVAPLLESAITRMDETVRAQANSLTEVTREFARELSADATKRREEAGAWVEGLGQRIDAAERARSSAHRVELGALSELASKTTREAAQREETLDARWAQLIARVDGQTEHARAEQAERLRSLDALAESVGGQLRALTSELGAQLEARREREAQNDERVQRVHGQLEESARVVSEAIERQERALAQLATSLPPLFQEAATVSRESAEAALAKLADTVDARLSSLSGTAADSITKLVEGTDTRLERVSKLLSDEMNERLSSESAHDERARAALSRLEQTAALLDKNIERQGANVEALVEQVGGMFAQLGDSAQERAHATLARLAESADEQAQRFASLSNALEAGRADQLKSLQDQLAGHALELEQRLEKTSALVHEAAASWQASTVEMQAVADVFAKSVDRQREASDAWLESLGEVEGAVERAGKHAARDALSDQLASTQEVFARQLQFQRELFEQLRSLRGATNARATHGEHDVSV